MHPASPETPPPGPAAAPFSLRAADPADGRAALWLTVLFLAAMWVFVPGLPGDFLHWDDNYYVRDNALLLVASWENVRLAFTQEYFSNYHPLTILSYMLDVQLFGYWAPWFRGVNLFLHAATVVATFGLLRAMGARWWVAWWAALLFAVHPLRVESVVWVAERKDVLCGFFYVMAVWLWVRGSGRDDRPAMIAGAVACLVLALLSKAMAVSLPFVFILHDVFLARGRVAGRLLLYAFVLGLAAAFMAANMMAQQHAVAHVLTLADRIRMAVYAPFHYLGATLWPVGLSPVYPVEVRPSARLIPLLAGVATCGASLALVVWSAPRHPRIAFGLLAAGVCLGPVSGIVAVGSAWAADRYSYLPTVLLLAGLAPVASDAIERLSPAIQRWLVGGASVAAALLIAGTHLFLPHWQDDAALWRRSLAMHPGVPRLEVAKMMFEVGRMGNPRAAAARVEGMWSSNSRVMFLGELRMAMQTVGNVSNTAGALAGADQNPDRRIGLRHALQLMVEHNNTDGVPERARELLAQPRIEHDDVAMAASALVMAGMDDEARAALARLDWPTRNAATAWGQLARRSLEAGNREQALADAQRAMAILPGEPNGLRTAVAVRLARGERAAAIRLARRAARHFSTPAYPRALAWTMLATQLGEGDAAQQAADERRAREKIGQELFSSEELVYLAYTAEQGRNLAWAGELYDLALQRDRRSIPAREGLAFLALSAGNLRRAEEWFAEILAINPDHAPARANLDRVRRQLGATGS